MRVNNNNHNVNNVDVFNISILVYIVRGVYKYVSK